jgi:hypothetical protein
MRRGMRTRMGAAALSICSLAMARPPVAGAQEADDAEAGEAIETLEGDASTVAGEVRLAGGEDVGALCAELRVGGADTDRAVAGLYSMKLPSSAFASPRTTAIAPAWGSTARAASAAKGAPTSWC